MTNNNIITQTQLKKILHYNQSTGIFTRKKDQSINIKSGDIAGTIRKPCNGKSYIQISVRGKIYYAHRLAYLYVIGKFPRNKTDHQDGNGLNNKWHNIKPATSKENSQNMRLRDNSISGCCGVNWHSKANKWQVTIGVNLKSIYLGLYSDIKKAISIRKKAEVKYGFHKNHGAIRAL